MTQGINYLKFVTADNLLYCADNLDVLRRQSWTWHVDISASTRSSSVSVCIPVACKHLWPSTSDPALWCAFAVWPATSTDNLECADVGHASRRAAAHHHDEDSSTAHILLLGLRWDIHS
jgi:hypothetical protein